MVVQRPTRVTAEQEPAFENVPDKAVHVVREVSSVYPTPKSRQDEGVVRVQDHVVEVAVLPQAVARPSKAKVLKSDLMFMVCSPLVV